MKPNYEALKANTVCPECKGTEMRLGYSYAEGLIHKKTSFLGMPVYRQVSNAVMIICKNCGLVVKSYATDPDKL